MRLIFLQKMREKRRTIRVPRFETKPVRNPQFRPTCPTEHTKNVEAFALRHIYRAILVLLCCCNCVAASETTGPENGTLVIVGGGDKNYRVFRHFIELAGGRDAKLVVVPTASSSDPDHNYYNHGTAEYALQTLGVSDITIVHTHNRALADTDAFAEPVRNATAVWFTGGRQWRIADAYLGTRTERAFHELLSRGGVIGGSSAGATIQGSFLARGDTGGNSEMLGDHQHGLGFVKNVAIDQHVIPRGREFDLIEVLEDPDGKMLPGINRAALLGIGIDEETGVVVRRNGFEVVGKPDGVVLVYNPRQWSTATPDFNKYQPLWIGGRYDLSKREIIDEGQRPQVAAVRHPEGFYKDIFMDGGISLTSRKTLAAAESLDLSYELYAGKNAELQQHLFAGNEHDANGVLLYPDGQPRFRMLYVNGGTAMKHGLSLGEDGRQAVADFCRRGGSYCGSCAGSFLSGRNTNERAEPREGYLHLFPWNTSTTGIKDARLGHRIPKESPLLKFDDFGNDFYVERVRHNGGNWLSTKSLREMEGVEVLATYDAPERKVHEGAAIWAWKESPATGRIVDIGSHPEGETTGERLRLTEACFEYALAGLGQPAIKAKLDDGDIIKMDRQTSDGLPKRTRIGDRQYHHFEIPIARDGTRVTLEIDSHADGDLHLYLQRGEPAFRSNATFGNTHPGATKTITATLSQGRWFASVECASTVLAQRDVTGSFYRYRGNLDVLNGIPYQLSFHSKQPRTRD